MDSDFLVALYKPDDTNHLKSTGIYKKIEHGYEFFALNIVFQEATTVISKRMDMQHARNFYESINKIILKKAYLDTKLEEKSWQIFLRQTRRGTSFVDCANLAALDYYKLDGILSFDRFYKGYLIQK